MKRCDCLAFGIWLSCEFSPQDGNKLNHLGGFVADLVAQSRSKQKYKTGSLMSQPEHCVTDLRQH